MSLALPKTTSTIFASLFVISKSIPKTLPTSFMACLVCNLLKVPICLTLSIPYLLIVYSINSPLRLSAISISKSGGDSLSGFRNLSKYSSHSIGSILVISIQYATAEPHPDPLILTTMPLSLQNFTKSRTTRK